MTSICYHADSFVWVLGTECRPVCLLGEFITDWATSLTHPYGISAHLCFGWFYPASIYLPVFSHLQYFLSMFMSHVLYYTIQAAPPHLPLAPTNRWRYNVAAYICACCLSERWRCRQNRSCCRFLLLNTLGSRCLSCPFWSPRASTPLHLGLRTLSCPGPDFLTTVPRVLGWDETASWLPTVMNAIAHTCVMKPQQTPKRSDSECFLVARYKESLGAPEGQESSASLPRKWLHRMSKISVSSPSQYLGCGSLPFGCPSGGLLIAVMMGRARTRLQ